MIMIFQNESIKQYVSKLHQNARPPRFSSWQAQNGDVYFYYAFNYYLTQVATLTRYLWVIENELVFEYCSASLTVNFPQFINTRY